MSEKDPVGQKLFDDLKRKAAGHRGLVSATAREDRIINYGVCLWAIFDILYQNRNAIRDELAQLQELVEKQVVYGPVAFTFTTFDTWCNKANSWFGQHGLTSSTVICLDTKGRICRIGRDFMKARDENTFPVTVYHYRAAQAARENQDVDIPK